MVETAIIGAGPYGLSLAAHLAAAGREFRIFGSPLASWRAHMPKDMHLKSDGFASNISSPDPRSTLKYWCSQRRIPYDDNHLPVALSTFLDYSAWFQERYVPMLEDSQVVSLARSTHGFELWLEDGEMVKAQRVILAVGIT
jgi:cation diffusion facilitator CzcD-associated flavoprotein CzcO